MALLDNCPNREFLFSVFKCLVVLAALISGFVYQPNDLSGAAVAFGFNIVTAEAVMLLSSALLTLICTADAIVTYSGTENNFKVSYEAFWSSSEDLFFMAYGAVRIVSL